MSKLIAVPPPLDAVDEQTARKNYIRRLRPSTPHLRSSRWPLSADRAVLFAQLVDNLTAGPTESPTELIGSDMNESEGFEW